MLVYRCPKCGAKVGVPDDAVVGGRFECAACDDPFVVPSTPPIAQLQANLNPIGRSDYVDAETMSAAEEAAPQAPPPEVSAAVTVATILGSIAFAALGITVVVGLVGVRTGGDALPRVVEPPAAVREVAAVVPVVKAAVVPVPPAPVVAVVPGAIDPAVWKKLAFDWSLSSVPMGVTAAAVPARFHFRPDFTIVVEWAAVAVDGRTALPAKTYTATVTAVTPTAAGAAVKCTSPAGDVAFTFRVEDRPEMLFVSQILAGGKSIELGFLPYRDDE